MNNIFLWVSASLELTGSIYNAVHSLSIAKEKALWAKAI